MDKKTFVELYVLSGGFRSDGERLWEKGDLERRGPALAKENERLRALLLDAKYVIEIAAHGLGLSVDRRVISTTVLLAEIDAALSAPAQPTAGQRGDGGEGETK